MLASVSPSPAVTRPMPYGPAVWYWGVNHGDTKMYVAGQLWQMASTDGRTRFIWQGDGNWVLYRDARPIWQSNTRATGDWLWLGRDGYLGILHICGCGAIIPVWAQAGIGEPAELKFEVTPGRVSMYERTGGTKYPWYEVHRFMLTGSW